jgi:hypothetical protein
MLGVAGGVEGDVGIAGFAGESKAWSIAREGGDSKGVFYR